MSVTGPGTRRGRLPASTSEPTEDSPITPSEGSDLSDIRAILANVAASLAQLSASQTAINERLERLESNSRNSTPMTGLPSRDSSAEQPDRPELGAHSHHLPDPKMPPPEMFSGKPSDFKNFMAQITLIFSVCPNTYCNDERRVLFVISRLKDEPLTWANDIAMNPGHPFRHDYPAFKQSLINIYGDRAFKAKSEDNLRTLNQTGSAAAYAQKFQSYAAPLALNDEAKCIMFFGGLKPEIQKACTMAGRATPFYALVDQAITFDQLSFQHSRHEKRETTRETTSKKRHVDNTSTKDSSSSSSSPKPTTSSGNYPSQPRGPLTQAEKDHRIENKLCMYCGKPGHLATDCPRKNPKMSSGATSVSNLQSHGPVLMYSVPSSTDGSENEESQHSRT
jgi:hypothetical protein